LHQQLFLDTLSKNLLSKLAKGKKKEGQQMVTLPHEVRSLSLSLSLSHAPAHKGCGKMIKRVPLHPESTPDA
jgi:hypothetical protein